MRSSGCSAADRSGGSCGGGWGGGGGWGAAAPTAAGGGGSHGSLWRLVARMVATVAGGGSHGSHGGGGGGYAYYDGGYYAHDADVSSMVARRPANRSQFAKRLSPGPSASQDPSDAARSGRSEVTLAGVPTKQTGEVRQFATTGLPPARFGTTTRSSSRSNATARRARRANDQAHRRPAQELSINFDSNSSSPS